MNTIFKTKTTIFFYFFIIAFLLSCGKGTDIIPTQPKCRLSKIKLLPDGSITEFTYNSQGQLISYKNTNTYVFSTFDYDSKGNVVKVLAYNDTFANPSKLYFEYGGKYDSNGNLLEISAEPKGFLSGTGITYALVIFNNQSQVTKLNYINGSENFEYDSKGNMTKKYSSTNPLYYIQYEYDNNKNPYSDLPWLIKYLYTGYEGFGINNVINVRTVDANSSPYDFSSKYEVNTDGYPTKRIFLKNSVNSIEYEYKCE